MWLAISLMVNFMLYMHSEGNTLHLTNPIVIPHPTFICALALTISVTIVYCQISFLTACQQVFVAIKAKNLSKIYKIALYGCDKAVEAKDYQHMALDSVLRLTIAAYALISFIYIIQRSYVGSLRINSDRIIRNTINFVFGVIWFRFLLLKALFIIEQFCRDQTEMDSVIKNLCPPYIKNGFNCTKSMLEKEQQIWYRLHYGLLKSAIVTCASELIPVLLVAHWIACGQAKKFAQQSLTLKMMAKNQIFKDFQKICSFQNQGTTNGI